MNLNTISSCQKICHKNHVQHVLTKSECIDPKNDERNLTSLTHLKNNSPKPSSTRRTGNNLHSLILDHNLHIRTVQARIALDFSRLGIRALERVKAAILELLYTN